MRYKHLTFESIAKYLRFLFNLAVFNVKKTGIWFIKRIPPEEIIPKHYGIAWPEYSFRRYVCMPIPFNLIARVGHIVYWFIKAPFYMFENWYLKHIPTIEELRRLKGRRK